MRATMASIQQVATNARGDESQSTLTSAVECPNQKWAQSATRIVANQQKNFASKKNYSTQSLDQKTSSSREQYDINSSTKLRNHSKTAGADSPAASIQSSSTQFVPSVESKNKQLSSPAKRKAAEISGFIDKHSQARTFHSAVLQNLSSGKKKWKDVESNGVDIEKKGRKDTMILRNEGRTNGVLHGGAHACPVVMRPVAKLVMDEIICSVNDRKAIAKALVRLHALCSQTESQEENCGAVQQLASVPLIGVMRRWKKDYDIQFSSLKILGNVHLYFTLDIGGLDCVLSAMQCFRSDLPLVLECCCALEKMQEDESFNQIFVCSPDGLNELLQAMNAFPMNLDLLKVTCKLLWKLSLVPGYGLKIMQSGCFSALSKTVELTFKTRDRMNDDIHWLACAALKHCCSDMQENLE